MDIRAFIADLPFHFWVESFLVLLIIYIIGVKRTYNPSKRGYGHRNPDELTEEEIDGQVDWWKPEPLVPPPKPSTATIDPVIIDRHDGKHVILEGSSDRLLNCSSTNFLGLAASKTVKQSALATMAEYGCGSCGPRGFYGTTQKHLEIEAALTEFLGVEETIAYSDSVATVSSSIPAFAKRSDLLVVDEAINPALRTGVTLSRSKVLYYKHNDMADLRRVLQTVRDKDRKYDTSTKQRRIIVTEGLFAANGHIAPLREILELKNEFKWRLLVDETLSFGALGETGLGATELAGCKPSDVEIMIGSLATSLASVGGFCAGSRQVVDHQRLSGAGYCYSASAPPFTCAVATSALQELKRDPSLLRTLRTLSADAHQQLSSLPHSTVISPAMSPVVHLLLDAVDTTAPRTDQSEILQRVVDDVRAQGIVISHSIDVSHAPSKHPQPLTLQVHVNALMTRDDIKQVKDVLTTVLRELGPSPAVADAGAGAGAGAGGSTVTKRK